MPSTKLLNLSALYLLLRICDKYIKNIPFISKIPRKFKNPPINVLCPKQLILKDSCIVFDHSYSVYDIIKYSTIVHTFRNWTCILSLHSKKCNVRLPYVKHALNVRYKTYVKRMDRALYVLRMFFTIRYTCVLKNMHLTHGLKNLHFTIPLKALCLHITTHALK